MNPASIKGHPTELGKTHDTHPTYIKYEYFSQPSNYTNSEVSSVRILFRSRRLDGDHNTPLPADVAREVFFIKELGKRILF